jgi:hypothetical protein
MYSRPRLTDTTAGKEPSKADVLSSKLNKLSIEERSSALDQLHGVADPMEETPDMINAKIQELTDALHSPIPGLGPEDSVAYRKALELSPEYVEGLKVRFLRSTRYNSQGAATRMLYFFSRKIELFGEETLARDLKFKDLNEEEQEALRNGLAQLLPQRDRAGRAIIFVSGEVSAMYPNNKSVVSTETEYVWRLWFFSFLSLDRNNPPCCDTVFLALCIRRCESCSIS